MKKSSKVNESHLRRHSGASGHKTSSLTNDKINLTGKDKLNKIIYNSTKRFLFKIDSEVTHNLFVSIGEVLGSNFLTKKLTSSLFYYSHPSLNQEVSGIKFENPIGLAAGFDYDARLTQIIPKTGFGFETIGSVTLGAYEGNPPPRLGRLIKSKSLLVNKGLKNPGTEKIIKKLENKNHTIPIGVSVAKTNCPSNSHDSAAIKDYIASLKLLEKSKIASFYEINISCPNSFGGEAFTTPSKLHDLLREVDRLDLKKPVFLKMPVDFSEKETDALCQVALKHNVQGLVIGNLTKNKNNSIFNKEEMKKAGKGSFSGLPTKNNSNRLIKFAYKHYHPRFVIIGCGGIFSAEDAYEKIKLGASLVQLITGMIYEGPGLISEINRGLIQLLKRDGFSNISEAIGKDNKIQNSKTN
jgi:dihydroorotate dehydrogenase